MSDRREKLDLLDSPIRPGISVIEASAGTGKTYSLTGLVLRLLLDHDASGTPYLEDIGQALVVTFTIAATDELTTRIRSRLHEAVQVFKGARTDDPLLRGLAERFAPGGLPRLERALKEFDRAAVCTIHGFCRRTLEQAAFESDMPLEVEFLHDHRPMVEQAARDVWSRHVVPSRILSGLTVGQQWTIDGLVRLFEQATRLPGTRIDPPGPPMGETLDRVERALDELARAWDRPAMERTIDELDWHSRSVYAKPGKLAESLWEMDRLAEGNLVAGLSALETFDPRAMEKKLKKGQQLPELPVFAPLARLVDLVADAWLALVHTFVGEVTSRFGRQKRRDHLLTFDDLLNRLRHALHRDDLGEALARSVHARYRVALIDEFQDTDPVQFDIFRRIFARVDPPRPVFFIGDPKQSIYSFRGADVFTYHDARDQAGDTVFSLGTNWRSETAMVQAVNRVFDRARRPFLYSWIEFDPVEAAGRADKVPLQDEVPGALHWWFFNSPHTDSKDNVKPLAARESGEAVLGRLASETVRLLSSPAVQIGDRPVRPSDIAVLVRTNRQAAEVHRVLRGSGVPSVIARTGDIMSSHEMDELLAVLSAVESPGHTGRLSAALATEMLGFGAEDIYAAQRDETRWNELVDRFEGYRRQWSDESRGFMSMVQSLMADHDVRGRLLAYIDGQRRLTNVLHAAEMVHEAIEQDNLSPAAVPAWVQKARSGELADDPERRELRLEADAEAVQIVTVHRAKGLEFDIVFCPFLWAARSADTTPPVLVRSQDDTVLYVAGPLPDGAAAVAEDQRLAEDLRLVYVALTRARHRTYVAWGHLGNNARSGKATLSALGYLLHQAGDPPDGEDLGWPARVMEHLPETMANWETQLRALAQEDPALMHLEVVDPAERDEPVYWALDPGEQDLLMPRRFPPRAVPRLEPWSGTSFSGLTRSLSAPTIEREQPPTSVPDIFAFGWAPAWRGRANITGSCMHSILEHLDFTRPEADQSVEMVRRMLASYRLDDRSAHLRPLDAGATVRAMIDRLVETPVPGTELVLGRLDRNHRLDELGFHLPLVGFDTGRLARLFKRAGGPAARYADRLTLLDKQTLRGYLTGFIDLVAEHRGRWYVLDWKFSHLGFAPQCYDRESIETSMIDHDYVLQYHLYVLALHRYLATRLPDYDYDTHVGGAVYVFLRGVDGTPDHGWYTDLKPPRELIESLDGLCRGGKR